VSQEVWEDPQGKGYLAKTDGGGVVQFLERFVGPEGSCIARQDPKSWENLGRATTINLGEWRAVLGTPRPPIVKITLRFR
jgi:hypothetical protein